MANEITKERQQFVAMANKLIQESRYQLTKTEQKAVLYMASKIKPTDEPNTEYAFSVKHFCNVCNFYKKGGWHAKRVREIVLGLKKNPLVIPLSNSSEVITSWFNDAVIDYDTGEIRVSFSKYLTPYLYELQSHYTSFMLEYILPMDSEYGIRLYEYLKSEAYKSEKNGAYKLYLTLDELRQKVGCEGRYNQSSDIRKYVVEPALKDINTYTDLKIEYKFVKQGRKVVAVEFFYIQMTDTAQMMREAQRQAALNPKEELPEDDLPY